MDDMDDDDDDVVAVASEPKRTPSSAECRKTPQNEVEEVVVHSELPKEPTLGLHERTTLQGI
eukprot:554748-Amphidinium_carterae.1